VDEGAAPAAGGITLLAGAGVNSGVLGGSVGRSGPTATRPGTLGGNPVVGAGCVPVAHEAERLAGRVWPAATCFCALAWYPVVAGAGVIPAT
jgi:hypothetical protein